MLSDKNPTIIPKTALNTETVINRLPAATGVIAAISVRNGNKKIFLKLYGMASATVAAP
jgi:hypothetical protein